MGLTFFFLFKGVAPQGWGKGCRGRGEVLDRSQCLQTLIILNQSCLIHSWSAVPESLYVLRCSRVSNNNNRRSMEGRQARMFCRKESATRKIILSPSKASRRQSGLFYVRMLAREVSGIHRQTSSVKHQHALSLPNASRYKTMKMIHNVFVCLVFFQRHSAFLGFPTSDFFGRSLSASA